MASFCRDAASLLSLESVDNGINPLVVMKQLFQPLDCNRGSEADCKKRQPASQNRARVKNHIGHPVQKQKVDEKHISGVFSQIGQRLANPPPEIQEREYTDENSSPTIQQPRQIPVVLIGEILGEEHKPQTQEHQNRDAQQRASEHISNAASLRNSSKRILLYAENAENRSKYILLIHTAIRRLNSIRHILQRDHGKNRSRPSDFFAERI